MTHSRKVARRLSAASISAALVVVAAACGSDSSDQAGGGNVELQFWTHTHPPMVELNEKLIAEFEEEHPNITIDYQTIPNTEFGTKMLTSLSTGAGPDVINMDDAALRGDYIPKELVSPIDPKAFGADAVEGVAGEYIDGALDGATGGEGEVYGVPSEFNGTAFAINTKHFEDAGLDPNAPPETWDDVIDYGEQLNQAGHDQAFNFLYLHEGWYYNQLSALLNQTGGQLISEDGETAQTTDEKNVAALELWVELARTSGIADPSSSSREATAPYTDLATGTQSMAIVYPWAMEQIEQSNPETYKNLKVVPLPQLSGGEPATFGYGYYWAVNSASEHPDEAWEFIAYLADNSPRWLSDVSFIQPVSDWAESPEAKELPAIDVWEQSYADVQFAEVNTRHLNEVKVALMNAINSAVFDGKPPEEALKAAGDEIQRSLG